MKLQTYILFLLLVLLSSSTKPEGPFSPKALSFTSSNYYSIYIMDQGKSSIEELGNMLLFYNPRIDEILAEEIASIYFEECIDEGVNHDIAFCQMILETGFLNYGGSVEKSQNNFCGLGATSQHVKGESFPDMRTGVRAHVQHLKAYASREEISKTIVDNRFKYVKRGSAKTIYALQGKWAMDPRYDKKLENLLKRLFALRLLSASNQYVYEIEEI